MKNIYVIYDKDKDSRKYKNKFNTEEITRSLKKLHNKFINLDEFNKGYNKFMDNIVKLEYYKSENGSGSVSPNQKKKKMRRYARDLKDIVDLYNIESGSDTRKKVKDFKILTNKQMLNRLPILLSQIQARNNSKSFKN